ncbi:MAG: GNAT family N-acetyltransferase [Candidatus Heimdallarchaeota archaeon]|nr:GNAT family N-acetyltransferase [Candidatus Heimdallarchaeota archaeon]
MIQIQPFQPDYKEKLYQLIKSADRALVGLSGEPKELLEEWTLKLEKGVWEMYVATFSKEKKEKKIEGPRAHLPEESNQGKEKQIIGLVTFFGDYEWDKELEEKEFEIGITVAKDFQRQGIGTKLINHVIERGKELGFEKASFWTREDNIPMQKIAERLDFQRIKQKEENNYTWIKYSSVINGKKS